MPIYLQLGPTQPTARMLRRIQRGAIRVESVQKSFLVETRSFKLVVYVEKAPGLHDKQARSDNNIYIMIITGHFQSEAFFKHILDDVALTSTQKKCLIEERTELENLLAMRMKQGNAMHDKGNDDEDLPKKKIEAKSLFVVVGVVHTEFLSECNFGLVFDGHYFQFRSFIGSGSPTARPKISATIRMPKKAP
jgi:hypothetical protein